MLIYFPFTVLSVSSTSYEKWVSEARDDPKYGEALLAQWLTDSDFNLQAGIGNTFLGRFLHEGSKIFVDVQQDFKRKKLDLEKQERFMCKLCYNVQPNNEGKPYCLECRKIEKLEKDCDCPCDRDPTMSSELYVIIHDIF